MNAQLVGKRLGVSTALAIVLPLALASSAFAQGHWYSPPPERGQVYSWADSPDYYGSPDGGAYGGEASVQPIFNYLRPPDRPYAGAPSVTEGYGGSAPPDGPTAYDGRGMFVVAIAGLNLRAGPNGNSPVRLSLPVGTPVHIAGPDVGGWRPVSTPSGSGWVYSRYLAPA